MGTRVGFYLFVGLILGAIIGNWLPFAASLETIAGGIAGIVMAVLVDKIGAGRAAPDNDQG